VFRKIDGHRDLAAFLVKEQWSQAASGGKVSRRSAGALRYNAFPQDSEQIPEATLRGGWLTFAPPLRQRDHPERPFRSSPDGVFLPAEVLAA
jgi:hypothetical protein